MNWIKPKIILTLIISIMLSLFFAEVFIRYLKPQRTYSEMLKLVGSYYAPDDKITFTIQKNYSGFEPTMDGRGNTVITTNSEGFRATKEPTTDKLSNILVIGDSYTL